MNTINTNKARMKNQRRKILIKRIQCACGIIGGLAFFYTIGIVGGLENDHMTIAQFISHAIPSITILGLSARIGIGLEEYK